MNILFQIRSGRAFSSYHSVVLLTFNVQISPWISFLHERRKAITSHFSEKETTGTATSWSLHKLLYYYVYFWSSKVGRKFTNKTRVTRSCFNADIFILVQNTLFVENTVCSWRTFPIVSFKINSLVQNCSKMTVHVCPAQKRTANANDWATSLSMQCIRRITPFIYPCLIALTCS